MVWPGTVPGTVGDAMPRPNPGGGRGRDDRPGLPAARVLSAALRCAMATDHLIARDAVIRQTAFDHIRGLQNRDLILSHEDIARGFMLKASAGRLEPAARHLQTPGDALSVEHPRRVPRKGGRIWYDDPRQVQRQIFGGEEELDYAFWGPIHRRRRTCGFAKPPSGRSPPSISWRSPPGATKPLWPSSPSMQGWLRPLPLLERRPQEKRWRCSFQLAGNGRSSRSSIGTGSARPSRISSTMPRPEQRQPHNSAGGPTSRSLPLRRPRLRVLDALALALQPRQVGQR